MILPIRNAVITEIREGGGSTKNYEKPRGTGNPKWTGRADAQLIEETFTDVAEGSRTLNEVIRTRLAFGADLVAVDVGDHIVYEHGGTTSAPRKVLDVSKPDPLGVVRVTFEDK